MKKTLLLSILIGSAAMLCAQNQPGFRIVGEIPGLKAGTPVKLVFQENGRKENLVETKAQDGRFELTGSVSSPSLCEIRIDGATERDMDKAVMLMVENTGIGVKAAHIDSVAPGFYFGTSGLTQEKNTVVEGGEAQREYKEFTDFMYPYTFASKQAHYNLYVDEKKDRTAEDERRLKAEYGAATLKEAAARKRFITEHPGYSISGLYWGELLDAPFSFTAPELDEIESKVSALSDTARLSSVKRKLAYARNYQRNTPYSDFEALDTVGARHKISSYMAPDKYVMIDFWASWCGPCRASIPHVRELYKEYGDRLEVLAVSLDSAEKPWRKAMDQEKMEWTQLWLNKELVEPAREAYQISGIPYMLLISPDGRLIFAGHNPDEVNEILEKELKK